MNNIPFSIKLAWRLLRTASHERTISSMVKLCFGGILISAFSLALVAAIMRGFEIVTHNNIKGIQADLIIRSSRPLKYAALKDIIETEFKDSIEAISPTSTYHAIIDVPERGSQKTDISTVSFLTVIDPATAQRATNLEKIITTPHNKQLPALLDSEQVLIGKDAAKLLDLKVGDTIELLYPAHEQTKKERLMLESAKATVGGIFSTGIEEYDLNGIFVSYDFIEEQFDEDAKITQINIKLKPGIRENELQQKLKERFNLPVITWQELYPAIIAALTLEKYGMLLILSLIVLVASMNTLSLLFMFISHKRRTLSLMYAYGMSRRALMLTCMLVGMFISCTAALLGLCAAYASSYLLNTYELIKLPEAYYVSYLPAHMDGQIMLIVVLLIVTVSLVTSWYPTRTLDRKRIASILKFEG